MDRGASLQRICFLSLRVSHAPRDRNTLFIPTYEEVLDRFLRCRRLLETEAPHFKRTGS